MKGQKGITLIALIITIIVMMILVGVSVTVALNGGLFSQAENAKRRTLNAVAEERDLDNERIKIAGVWYDSYDDYIAGIPSTNQGEETIVQLEGKSLLAIGDSFVYGHTLGHTSGKTWEEKIASRNNMTLNVYATNGISLGGSNSSTISKGLESAISGISSVDYIVILGGHNDANASLNGGSQVPIGSNTDTEYTTYKGAINYMITTLQDKYPSAYILFCTPFLRNNTEESYAEAMKEVCAYRSVSCFDDFNDSGLNFVNTTVKNLYELDNSKHFNEDGQLLLSYIYEKVLENQIYFNNSSIKPLEFVDNLETYTNMTKNINTFYVVNGVGIYFNNILQSTTDTEQGTTNTEGSNFISLSDISDTFSRPKPPNNTNRVLWYGTIPSGVTLDFSTSLGSTYKYAIGIGNNGSNTPWVGGGYQSGSYTTTEEAGYTIQFANKDGSTDIDNTTAQALIDTFGYSN